ncbi:MAG TPA: hypothetical protein VE685_06000 [Thermoanaerobaculia bacterium]|nr:hypothetical protein [Thermoanaerobaculia bacterium]
MLSSLRLHARVVTMLAVLAVTATLFAATMRTEDGTAEDQLKVRTSRDVSTLPLKSKCTVVPRKELFITDLSVVEDCYRTTWRNDCPQPAYQPATQGAWTFGRLAEGIFGTTDPQELSDLTLRWLGQWHSPQTINGDTSPARPNIKTLVVDPWDLADGQDDDVLDMTLAPLRLLAIVSRLDLRQNSGYSAGVTAGEGRFVFGVLRSNGQPSEFVVILEYGLDAADCSEVLDWARSWHSLGSIPSGDRYNAALQEITDRFASIGASPAKPNGSALNQLRTNEFLTSPWELREFRLQPDPGSLGPAPLLQFTVAQTPANGHQRSALLANYANANASAILNNQHIVPLTWNGVAFRGGRSHHALDFNWDGPPPACTSIRNDVRHNLSLNTCNGCHGGETDTVFKHVEPRAAGQEAQLSAFLTGNPLSIDMCNGIHSFGDIERRRVDLCQLLAKSCSQVEAEPSISFAH